MPPSSRSPPLPTNPPTISFPPLPSSCKDRRTILLAPASTPLSLRLAAQWLQNGDNVVGCVRHAAEVGEVEDALKPCGAEGGDVVEARGEGGGEGGGKQRSADTKDRSSGGGKGKGEKSKGATSTSATTGRRKGRLCIVRADGRYVSQVQAAVAQARDLFGGVDMCVWAGGEALIGTVEELGQSAATQALAREHFETNFHAPVNFIKGVLPVMRAAERGRGGHVLVLSSVANHLGTPSLPLTCASGWSLDSFCDSLAYEVAPFNIKVSIVQPNLEVHLLTNPITAAPALDAYTNPQNPAPGRATFANMLKGVEERVTPAAEEDERNQNGEGEGEGHAAAEVGERLMSGEIERFMPQLSPETTDALLAETVHAVCAIAGHGNPPARHIVGFEGVASVKEKLKTVSEELEDFVNVSCAVDFQDQDEEEEGMEVDNASGEG